MYDGDLHYVHGYGVANIVPGPDVPMRIDAIMPVTSRSKTITALSVLAAIEDYGG